MSNRPSAIQPPSSRIRPGKKKTKQEEEEERLAKEAAELAALQAAIPPSPFDRIDEVWALSSDLVAQRALVSQLFDCEDGPGVCRQSLALDDIVSHLHFARRTGLNNAQTRAFYELMHSVQQRMATQPEVGMEESFAQFKQALLANVDVGRPAPEPAVPAIPIPAPVAVPDKADKKGGGRPGSSKGDRPGSSARARREAAAKGSGTPRGAAAAAAAAEDPSTPRSPLPAPAAPAADSRFSVSQLRAITEYATQGYFQHYRLLQASFNPALFRPRARVVRQSLLLETPAPLWPHEEGDLERAVDLTQERRRREDRAAAQQAQQAAKAAMEEAKRAASQAEQDDSSAASSRPQTARSAAAEQSPQEELQPSDELSQLVHLHLQKARAQLLSMVQDNERQLEDKLRGLEEKLASAQPPPKGSAAARKK